MDNFRNSFIEEAKELINDLEESSLQLEKTPEDVELIEQIFRIMHSLKGGSAMFGFSQIDEYTHQLESIYDQVRNGKVKVNRDILDITLASVDHVSNLLDDECAKQPQVVEDHLRLLEAVRKLSEVSMEVAQVSSEEISETSEAQMKTFYVSFVPKSYILYNGTNPLYLVDEFHSLGPARVFANSMKLPGLKELQPNDCYFSWEIIVATDQGKDALDEVFMFVEDESDIFIHELASRNLFEEEGFNTFLDDKAAKELPLGVEALKKYLEPAPVEKEEKSVLGKTSQDNPNKEKNIISSIRVSSDKLDELMNLISELVTNQASLSLYAEKSKDPALVSIGENMEKITRSLRETTFDICLIPIGTIVTRFQRLVRDLSAELGKEIDFVTEGTETELDKNIIESLSNPILHILRNCIDHGVESKEERIKAGKSEKGRIHLKAYYSGIYVYIQISDDGKGIDMERVREKAISQGLINPETNPSEKEILDLIFLPGFSTAKKVTDVSGRGVGMDVVKKKISEIRGEVTIDSQKGEGTTFTIKLPVTLSIIDGLLVELGDTNFIIPLPFIDKVYEMDAQMLLQGYNNVVTLDGELYPYFHLRDEFETIGECPEVVKLILVRFDDKQVALSVDAIIGEYQAVLKPMGKVFKNQEYISGATILGSGTVALVLDTNKIIERFSN